MLSLATAAMAAAQTTTAEIAGDHAATTAWWEDTATWVSLAFLVVVGFFIYAGVHKKIGAALAKRSQKIADELDQARRLREEAQELLAQYQRRQREAEEEAKSVIEQARRDAKRYAAEARDKINEQIERRARAAEDKIARAESQALAEVRGQTADLAVEAAKEIIRTRMDQGAQSALIERAISDLRSRKLH